MSIEVTNLKFRSVTAGKILAGVTVTFNDVLEVHCTVNDGTNGPFLSFPRSQGKDTKWYNQVFVTDKDLLANINDRVIQSFAAWKEQGSSPAPVAKKTTSAAAEFGKEPF